MPYEKQAKIIYRYLNIEVSKLSLYQCIVLIDYESKREIKHTHPQQQQNQTIY